MELPIVMIDNQTAENFQLPDPDLLTYYKNLEQRIIYIEGELDELTSDYQKQILIWNQEDKDIPMSERKPIKVMINSPGGILADAISLAHTIVLSKTPVYTYNIAEACSGAFLLLIAGHRRFAMKYSVALYHSGSGNIGGTYDETVQASKWYKKIVSNMEDFVIENTIITKQSLSRHRKSDWYMDSDEQIANGVADEIVTDISQIIGEGGD